MAEYLDADCIGSQFCTGCRLSGGWFESKNMKTKSVAVLSAFSAALGITELAILGINLRFLKPLVCGMAGGAVGALLGLYSI